MSIVKNLATLKSLQNFGKKLVAETCCCIIHSNCFIDENATSKCKEFCVSPFCVANLPTLKVKNQEILTKNLAKLEIQTLSGLKFNF